MNLAVVTEPIPLAPDLDGVVRVGGTRVTLDTVVTAFNEGFSAEEIVQQYQSLDLADVYAVISYYLRQRADVDRYLDQRRQRAAEIRKRNELQFPSHHLREQLLARRAAQEVNYVATGG